MHILLYDPELHLGATEHPISLWANCSVVPEEHYGAHGPSRALQVAVVPRLTILVISPYVKADVQTQGPWLLYSMYGELLDFVWLNPSAGALQNNDFKFCLTLPTMFAVWTNTWKKGSPK